MTDINFPDSRHYILNEEHVPIPAGLFEWAWWLQDFRHRIVQQDTVDGYWISTVFLGLDHNWGDGPPLLFETMIFEGDARDDTGFQRRYPTWELALEGHRHAVELAAAGGPFDE